MLQREARKSRNGVGSLWICGFGGNCEVNLESGVKELEIIELSFEGNEGVRLVTNMISVVE